MKISLNLLLCVAIVLNASCKKSNPLALPITTTPNPRILKLDSTLNDPRDLVVDKNGNIFISESLISNITKISPNGIKTTFAGIGRGDYINGTGIAAAFNVPMEMVFDSNGNLFVCDGNNLVRKITPAGVVSTLATSKWIQPLGITIDNNENFFVFDNNSVVKINQVGDVNPFAGGKWGSTDGPGANAGFENSRSMSFDSKSDNIMLVDGSGLIRKINSAGVVSTIPNFKLTFAGENGSNVGFSQGIFGIVNDKAGNTFVSDYYGRRIVKITPSGKVTDYVDGKKDRITFNALAIDDLGNLYALDNSGDVRKGKLYKIIQQP